MVQSTQMRGIRDVCIRDMVLGAKYTFYLGTWTLPNKHAARALAIMWEPGLQPPVSESLNQFLLQMHQSTGSA